MTDDIDYRKLAKQEPEFEVFAKQAVFDFMNLASPDMLKAIYSFWAIGMTQQQVHDWLKIYIKLGGSDD